MEMKGTGEGNTVATTRKINYNKYIKYRKKGRKI